MSSSDPLAALIARFPGPARVIAACGLVFGSLGVLWATYNIARIPWELDERSPTVLSSSATCGTFTGALYTIERGGETHTCLGAETKCPREAHVPIAYDAEKPWRCRVANRVGRPTLNELDFLLGALLWLACAVAVFTSPSASESIETSPRASFGYRLSRGVLMIAAVLAVLVWLARLGGEGVP